MEGENNINEMYRECLRNHAASLGSYATDGCGEFTPDHNDTTSPGTAGLNCAACGCHRKVIHTAAETIDYGAGSGRQPPTAMAAHSPESSERVGSKKRFRTKFTEEQKEKMMGFAEKLGWKMQRKDAEDETEVFCRGAGISRKVSEVWMHNHKNSSAASSSIILYFLAYHIPSLRFLFNLKSDSL